MVVREVQAKSVLRVHKKIDSWFVSRYGMNLYRGCSHNCVYCDGRSEGYYVEGEFGVDVDVKVNAIDVLRKELEPRGRRKPLKRGYIMLGGGVGDSYQPLEEKYELTRRALNLAYEHNFPVHMLTKSTLIRRDIDILRKIDEMSRVIVSCSFSSLDDKIAGIFEPGVPPPSQRLQMLCEFKERGIACGMFLLPAIPLVTDTPEFIENSVRNAKAAGLDFIVFGGMTLKEGRQKEYFMKSLKGHYPELVAGYEKLYLGDKWGNANKEYYASIDRIFSDMAKKYRMPRRISPSLYRDILDRNDLVVVILEQLDYLLRSEGKESNYGYAAYSISRLEEPLHAMKDRLRAIRGVGAETEKLILEILETGRCSLHERLLEG